LFDERRVFMISAEVPEVGKTRSRHDLHGDGRVARRGLTIVELRGTTQGRSRARPRGNSTRAVREAEGHASEVYGITLV
jgi:hypothetical protein